MTQSSAAQVAATDPCASVWVAANAGTGKTHVLTQRVIRLLLEGTPPERILCLTFTKAAAAEMANRLFSTLGNWATWPDEDLKSALESASQSSVRREQLQLARRLFARALETPGGLKIQTIHAFCERLLACFPLEAGIAPHFEVLDERIVAELMSAARDDILLNAYGLGSDELNDALETIIAHASDMRFETLLREIAGKRRKIAALLNGPNGLVGAVKRTRDHLGLSETDTIETILEGARAGFESARRDLKKAAKVLSGGSKTDASRSDTISEYADSDLEDSDFALYAGAFLKKDGEPQKSVATADMRRANPWLEDLLRTEQTRVYELSGKLKSANIFEATCAVLKIAAHFLQRYEDRKRARAGVDFDDLINHTNDLLRSSDAAAWVLYKLDGGLDHILVDEAQDTSPEQWSVIEALGEEFFSGFGARADQAPDQSRSVFAVGDQKQSIYSFQGADPAMFAEMRSKFRDRVEGGAKTWQQVDLDRSFRSTQPILSAVDAVFSGDDMSGYVTASERYISHVADREGEAGLVELWPAIGPSEIASGDPWDAPLDQIQVTDPRAQLAARIADTIDGWLDTNESLASQGRPIEPRDIMILVRRRDAFMEEMIRSLKNRNIPVSGADRMVLTDHIAVMDLIALGSFVLLPGDDLNLATLLKSPFVGLTEEELFDLAFKRKGSMWEALSEKAAAAPDTAYSQAYESLSHLLQGAKDDRPFDFYQRVLDLQFIRERGAPSGYEMMLRRLGKDAEDPIREYLNLALAYERMALPTLQGFLQWVQSGDVQLKRELESGKNEVRVMTVHGAKGLESRVVFLPDTCDAPDGRHDPQLLETEGGMLLWPGRKSNDDAAACAAREILARKRRAEYYRLLYVAMTRAEDRLYVAGFHGKRGAAAGSWYGVISDALKPIAQTVPVSFEETGMRLACEQSVPVAEPIERVPTAGGSKDNSTPPWLKTKAPKETVSVRSAPSRFTENVSDEIGPGLLSPLGAGERSRFERGRLIHKLLQYLPDVPQADHVDVAQHYFDRLASHLSAEERHEMFSETLDVITHEQFAPIFGPGSKAEVPLVGRAANFPDGVIVNGQVDRLLIESERVLIVDYKTNRPPPLEPQGVSAVYLRQMACYRGLLQEICPGRSIECALLWTDEPRLMVLPDVLLTDALLHMNATKL